MRVAVKSPRSCDVDSCTLAAAMEAQQRQNFMTALPTELSLNIIQRAAAASLDPVRTLAAIRRVSHAGANLATDLLVSESLKRFGSRLEQVQNDLNGKWGQGPTEQQGRRLTNIFNNVSRLSEELAILRKKIQEKQASRALIVKDAAKLPPATVDAVLATMGFTSELLLLQELRKSLQREEQTLEHFREPNYVYRDPRDPRFDPLRDDRHRPPHYPMPPPPGFYPGEPDRDHLAPPDWERDRLPGVPGMPWDPNNPFSPFGPGPMGGSGPNPFNPHGNFGRGPRYL